MRRQTKLICGACRRPLDYVDDHDGGKPCLDCGMFIHRDDGSPIRTTCRSAAVTNSRRSSG